MKVLLFFLLLAQVAFGQTGFGSVQGSLIGNEEEPVIFAKIALYAEDNLDSKIIGGAYSDFDGLFKITAILPGTYMLLITDQASGADTLRLAEIRVEANQITRFDDLQMTFRDIVIECKTLEQREPPRGLQADPFGRIQIIKPEDIKRD